MVVEEVSAVYFKNPSKTHKTNKEQTLKANNKQKRINKQQKTPTQKWPQFLEPWQVCLSPYSGSEIPLKYSWVHILNPPPRSSYAVSCENRYHRPARIRATSSWHETPLSQQLTHSAFVSAFCFALWRACYSSPIPS